MLFARTLGWIMALGGVVLLQSHHSAWAGFAEVWNVGGEPPLDYMTQSLGASLSPAQSSHLLAVALIVLGVLMAWVCRRPRYE